MTIFTFILLEHIAFLWIALSQPHDLTEEPYLYKNNFTMEANIKYYLF